MTNRKITVLIVEPGKRPRAAKIDNELETFQEIVGGYIEAIYPYRDRVALICNDEGKFDGSLPNRPLPDYDTVYGAFVIAGITDEDFDSLNDAQVRRYSRIFRYPGVYIGEPDTVLA